MLKGKLAMLSAAILIGATVLGACGPLPEEVIIEETSAVIETAVAEVTAAVAAEGVASATPEPEPTDTPAPELEGLWYPLGADPGTLDPASSDIDPHLIITQLIEGLYEYRGDGSIEPTGATGFEVSDDGRVYTVHLRPEAVWSDGEPVVAQHFVDGILRLLDPDTESDNAWYMYDVEGAEAFHMGETDDPATVGVRAVDDLTLEVRLAAPASYFETILAFNVFHPIRLDLIEAHGERWTEPGNYLSNGPYLLDAWVHGERIVLVKNPAYWNADAVRIDRITLPVVLEYAAMLDMYEQDEVHCTGAGSPVFEARARANPALEQETHLLPKPSVYYVGLNTRRPPTDDVNVRKALTSAVDRDAWMVEVWGIPPGWGHELSCTTPPTIPGHQAYGTCGYTFDPEQARAYLAEAGYPGGEGFPALQLWIDSNGPHVAQVVAAMWEENLGISVEVRTSDWDRYLHDLDGCIESQEALAACEFNAYYLGWWLDYGDAQNQLEVVFAPYSTYQYTGWQSERYEELMALAKEELDSTQRAEYYKEADKILCEDEVAILPIVYNSWSYLVKPGITFEFPPFGQPAFKHWALP